MNAAGAQEVAAEMFAVRDHTELDGVREVFTEIGRRWAKYADQLRRNRVSDFPAPDYRSQVCVWNGQEHSWTDDRGDQ